MTNRHTKRPRNDQSRGNDGRADDGWEDAHRGRSNRARGADDDSTFGRGHNFGPNTSGRNRMAARRTFAAQWEERTKEARNPFQRNYNRMAASRESRGPETGEFLEHEAYPSGRVRGQGYGSRSRSMESTRYPDRGRARDSFDDDLER